MALDFKTINQIIGVDDSFKMPAILMEKLFDKEKREEIFDAFFEQEKDTSFDWFHVYFQEEYAERKTKKQDFTPDELGELLSKILGEGQNSGMSMDIAAGTGGLTIRKWHEDRLKHNPFMYRPSMYLYHCEELSDRALPFLLFNLAIRGMNATVFHGDTLTREAKQIYFIQNDQDDTFKYSSINVMPHSPIVEQEFDVRKWLDDPIKHIESPAIELEKIEGQMSLF